MASSSSPETSAALQSELKQIEENSRTLLRMSASRAKVGQHQKK
jgi:hypothetical protein